MQQACNDTHKLTLFLHVRSVISVAEGSLEYLKFPLLKFDVFFQYFSYLFPEVFLCDISSNFNKW